MLGRPLQRLAELVTMTAAPAAGGGVGDHDGRSMPGGSGWDGRVGGVGDHDGRSRLLGGHPMRAGTLAALSGGSPQRAAAQRSAHVDSSMCDMLRGRKQRSHE